MGEGLLPSRLTSLFPLEPPVLLPAPESPLELAGACPQLAILLLHWPGPRFRAAEHAEEQAIWYSSLVSRPLPTLACSYPRPSAWPWRLFNHPKPSVTLAHRKELQSGGGTVVLGGLQ